MNEARRIKILSIVQRRQSGIIVVLEDIHDPHNAAAILRTCDGLGIQHVCFIFGKEKKYNPRNIGKASSSTANKWLDFEVFDSTKSCLQELKRNGYTIIATALSGTSESLLSAQFPEKKIAILVGNEHRGLSEESIRSADRVIMIPMMGFVQSLNVSVATAIVLWELTRKQAEKRRLSRTEQQKLMKDLIQRSG